MQSVNFTDFRKNASSYLTLVEEGETVEIRRHGKVVARLTPPDNPTKVANWKKPGLRLKASGGSLSETILEDRR